MASRNGNQDPFDSIYFKNHIQNKHKNKLDIKEIALFSGSVCFICLLSLGIIHLITKSKDNSQNNRNNNNIINSSAEDATTNFETPTQMHTDVPTETTAGTTEGKLVEDATEQISSIPASAIKINNHYYQLFDNAASSWEDAADFCESLGGHLAVINDSDENAHLFSYMKEQGYSSAYFGFTDREDEGIWKWVNGKESSYVNWASGEPNSQNSEENYAMFYFKFTDGSWNDGRWGDDTTAFICEWDEGDTVAEEIKNPEEQYEAIDMNDFHNAVYSITASSQLADEVFDDSTHNYSPYKVIDGDLSTCWCEGKEDNGIGETLTIEFDNTYLIHEVTLWNGLCTNEDLYNKNSRIHNIRIILSDGKTFDYECENGWSNRQVTIKFPEKIETAFITFQIIDIYEGGKYKDTCISEISVA